MIGYLQRQVRELAKKRAYCKNTVAGKQRGKKYPAAFRAEVVMAMLGSNSICAVAKRYGVPESTIRSWMSEEAGRSDAFAKARQEAAREIAIRASLGVRAQVTFLQGRAAESQRAAQITERLHRRLDEDTRARAFAVGTLLKDDPEELAEYTRRLTAEQARQMDRALRRQYPGAAVLTTGGCTLCEECTRPMGRPCRHPQAVGYSPVSYTHLTLPTT